MSTHADNVVDFAGPYQTWQKFTGKSFADFLRAYRRWRDLLRGVSSRDLSPSVFVEEEKRWHAIEEAPARRLSSVRGDSRFRAHSTLFLHKLYSAADKHKVEPSTLLKAFDSWRSSDRPSDDDFSLSELDGLWARFLRGFRPS